MIINDIYSTYNRRIKRFRLATGIIGYSKAGSKTKAVFIKSRKVFLYKAKKKFT